MKKKLFALAAVLMALAMILSLAGCSSTGEEETTETTIVKKTPDLPTEQLYSVDDKGETFYLDADGSTIADTTILDEKGIADKNQKLFDYFKINSDILTDGSTKATVVRSEKKSIGKQSDEEGNSIKYSENAQVNGAIDGLKKLLLVSADDVTTEYTSELKDAFPGENYVCNLTAADIESSTCVDKETTRVIVLNLKSPVPEEIIKANFDMEDKDAVLAEFDKVADYMTVNKDVKLSYTGCSIEIETDITTDEILSIKYVKGVNVDAEVIGAGTLAAVGTVPVKFLYTYTVSYSIDRTEPVSAAD